MGQNFIPIERDQSFLLPPDVRDWLPADHEVWLLLAALDQLDLSGFYATYRADGHGRAAYDPAMMVGLLLWAYSDGVRSSRAVQRRCERDVAYRVVTGNQVPDHATIARFLARHRSLMEDLFAQVLGLCAEAGLVRVGVIALDGTKLRGNASPAANRDLAGLDAAIVAEVARILDQAQAVDAAEDARFGADRRGDEPPPGMGTSSERLERLRAAKARLAERGTAEQAAQDQRRTDWELAVAQGRNAGRRPGPHPPPRTRGSKLINTTDPDAKIMKTRQGFLQGYNGQIVVCGTQIIITAGLAPGSDDSTSLHPMLDKARATLDRIGVNDKIRAVLADSGYGGHTNLSTPTEPILLIPTTSGRTRKVTAQPRHPAVAAAAARRANPAGKALYRRRASMVEPVFGQIKQRLGDHLASRSRPAATAEWNLITTSHNLKKLLRWQAHTATT